MFYQQVEVFKKTKNNNFEDIEDNYINSVSQNNYNNNNQKLGLQKQIMNFLLQKILNLKQEQDMISETTLLKTFFMM